MTYFDVHQSFEALPRDLKWIPVRQTRDKIETPLRLTTSCRFQLLVMDAHFCLFHFLSCASDGPPYERVGDCRWKNLNQISKGALFDENGVS